MMIGQIVEIPKDSSIYSDDMPSFSNKRDELIWKTNKREYSLFDGFLVGEHLGFEKFMLGQSKGLNISGKAEPVYIIAIDKLDNRLFVGQGKDHPGLFSDVFKFSSHEISWDEDFNLSDEFQLEVNCKFSKSMQTGILYKYENVLYLEFKTAIPIYIKNYLIELFYENEKVATINKH